MKRLLMIVLPLLLIVGCIPPPPFSIEPMGDKFSDPNGPKGFMGNNNRLSKKSSNGGIHLDNKGVYMNPYVVQKDDVQKVGFSVSHTSFEYTDLFNPIQSIVFLNQNQDRVELKCRLLDVDVDLGYYNSVSQDLIGTASELSDCECLKEDFNKLVNSTTLEIKINGGERSMVYETKDVLPTFISNLKTFSQQKIR